ncbi:MAG TPA: ester cyclase [Rhodanobacter sp.]
MDPKAVVLDFIAAHNRHDIAGMLARLTENAEIADPASPIPLHGKADIEPQYRIIFGAVPDIHFEVTHLIAEGDLVFAALHTTGRGAGEFMGRDITGKKIEVAEAMLARIEGGRIAWGQFYSDTAKLSLALGYQPNPV